MNFLWLNAKAVDAIRLISLFYYFVYAVNNHLQVFLLLLFIKPLRFTTIEQNKTTATMQSGNLWQQKCNNQGVGKGE